MTYYSVERTIERLILKFKSKRSGLTTHELLLLQIKKQNA
jgi:hypothetical protein